MAVDGMIKSQKMSGSSPGCWAEATGLSLSENISSIWAGWESRKRTLRFPAGWQVSTMASSSFHHKVAGKARGAACGQTYQGLLGTAINPTFEWGMAHLTIYMGICSLTQPLLKATAERPTIKRWAVSEHRMNMY